MPNPNSNIFTGVERKNVSPTKTVGAPGTAIYNGYVQSNEKNSRLADPESRMTIYSDILSNVSIVAAGTRYFLNLAAKADWHFRPSEADKSGEFAEKTEKALTEDPRTPWHRIVRRAAMFRFYGFSVQEWTMMRDEEGYLTFKDIAPRGQRTITQWDVERDGEVRGMIQRSPQTQEKIYIPRKKTMYLVDDTLSDSPEGLGLFRHLVEPSQTVRRYAQLEGFGYETDLRGVPIVRMPLGEMASAVANGDMSAAERTMMEAPLREFVQNHVKTPDMGLILDSVTYAGDDEAQRPSAEKLWDVELLKGAGTGTQFQDIAKAIDRMNREMARILGVEQLMLGSDGAGSFALSRDKTSSFFLLIDGALQEIVESVKNDLINNLWSHNGWPNEMKPDVGTEAVRHSDVNEVSEVLRNMATAGAILDPEDPVIAQVRDLMGVDRPPEEPSAAMEAMLMGNQPDKPKDRHGE